MTTLMMPSLERRLKMVREEVAAKPVQEWSPPSLQWCVKILREMRVSAAEMRQALEGTEGFAVVQRVRQLLADVEKMTR